MHVPGPCICRFEPCASKTLQNTQSHIAFAPGITVKCLKMALLNKFTTACWKNFQGDRLNKQFFILRVLHKSAASETFGISTAGDDAMTDRLMTPTDVADKSTIKTLKEMPGPSTLSNLVEFFWRDGFSRIHEIQVTLCVFWGLYFHLL